jgi:hypothetical protein
MTDSVVAALIAAGASVVGSLLIFMVGICSLRRSVATSNGVPLGRLIEARLDELEERLRETGGRLDRVEVSLIELREWLAYQVGKATPPFWTPRPGG